MRSQGDKPKWSLNLFGRVRVVGAGVTLDSFSSRRSAYLLARVGLLPRKEIARSDAADLLWPEDFYDATRIRLRQELTRLRRALGPASEIVGTVSDWISLDMSIVEVDVDVFEATLRAAEGETTPERREALLRSAIDIGSDPLVEGAEESWIVNERVRLQDLLYAAFTALGGLLMAKGESQEALAFARRAIDLRPIDERAHLLAMRLLASLDRVTESLSQFESLRDATRESGGRLSANAERFAESLRGAGRMQRAGPEHETLRFNTPHPAEPIVGREAELEDIVARLSPQSGTARFVTLLGPGGIGKTRLLIEAAIHLRPHFQGRVATVDLSELEDVRLVPLAILRELGADRIPSGDPVAHLIGVIPKTPILLALDNLEHFGTPIRALARKLVESCSELRILATSRTTLDFPGEHRLQVGPLRLPEDLGNGKDAADSPAMRLFLNALSRESFHIPNEAKDLDAMRSIVRRLEGIPLALQLGAARLRTLGPQELDAQLQMSLDVLETKRAGTPKRHHSIRQAVEGSIHALPDNLQYTLAELSVFRGGWTLGAAQEVCRITDAVETMEKLLDVSLIYVANEGHRMRFRMLDAIREHARARLGRDQLQAVRRRHAEWLSGLADAAAVDYPDRHHLLAFDALEAELGNLREALHFALDFDPQLAFRFGACLGFFWRSRTHPFEAGRFYQDLLNRHKEADVDVDVARSTCGAALIALMNGAEDSVETCERALGLCQALGLQREEARVLALLGVRAQDDINYPEAAKYLEAAERLVEVGQDAGDRARLALSKGYCAYYQGLTEEAVLLLQTSVAGFSEIGEVFYCTQARYLLAKAAAELGQYDIAEQALDGLLDLAIECRFMPIVPYIQSAEGLLALCQGRFRDAFRLFEASRTAWQTRRVAYLEAEQCCWLGRTYLDSGDLDTAGRYAVEAASMWLACGAMNAAGFALVNLGAVLWQRGAHAESAEVTTVGLEELKRNKARLTRFEQLYVETLTIKIQNTLGSTALEPTGHTIRSIIARYTPKP